MQTRLIRRDHALSAGRRGMRLLPVLGFVAGAALSGWLLSAYGVGAILHLVGDAGWLLVPAVLFHLTQIVASAVGWQAVVGGTGTRLGVGRYVLLRLLREGVNNLLPVAQIGGPVIGVRGLRRLGVPLAEAVAGTIGDLTLEMVTQIVFTLIALGLLVSWMGAAGIARTVAAGLIGAAALAGGLIAAQTLGLSALIDRLLRRFGAAAGLGLGDGLQPALNALYRSRRRLTGGAVWHGISWALGGIEVSLMLHALGHDVGVGQGLVIEMLGQALKSAGFVVPGALGVQEGGLVVVCGLFHISPEVAIALSLVKRLREVSYGLPSLLLWRMGKESQVALAAVPPGP